VSRSKAKTIIEAALSQGRGTLSEHEAKGVLEAYGVPVTKERLVESADELAEALAASTYRSS